MKIKKIISNKNIHLMFLIAIIFSALTANYEL